MKGSTRVWFVVIVSLLESTVVSINAIPDRKNVSTLYRGKYIGNLISSESLYSTYKEVQKDYLQKNESKDWKIVRSKDRVEISILKSIDDPYCPFIRMRAVMPATPKTLSLFMGFQNWGTFMRLINPFYDGITILREYSYGDARMTMVRKKSTRILGFGRRDFGLVSVLDTPRSDGVCMSGTFSIISAGLIPHQPGFTRAFQDSICVYKPMPNDETEMTIILRTDLNDSTDGGSGGFVPMWAVVKTIGTAGYQAIKGLRNHVQYIPEEQDANVYHQ